MKWVELSEGGLIEEILEEMGIGQFAEGLAGQDKKFGFNSKCNGNHRKVLF